MRPLLNLLAQFFNLVLSLLHWSSKTLLFFKGILALLYESLQPCTMNIM